MLRRAGYDDVTVFERGERVGGVWNDNTYPGARCDVPSHLYEFSFAPNPYWSHRYADQREIQEYMEDVARRFGVADRIRTGTEVTRASWGDGRWVVETSRGRHEADVLLTACGQLSTPSVPRDPRARRLRRPDLPHRPLAPRRRPRRQARGRGRDRLQRDPGRARDPAARRARRRLPALAGLDDPEAGLRLPRAHEAPVRALPAAPAPRPPGELRLPRVRRARADPPPMADEAREGGVAHADQPRDQRSGAAAQGHADRRDRLQADHAHRRLVSDAHQAERRPRHRPRRGRDRRRASSPAATSGPPT